MAKFEDLIKCLCTEEMMDSGKAKQVKAKDKTGYLVSYDAGLGFGMWSEDGDEPELWIGEIEILK